MSCPRKYGVPDAILRDNKLQSAPGAMVQRDSKLRSTLPRIHHPRAGFTQFVDKINKEPT